MNPAPGRVGRARVYAVLIAIAVTFTDFGVAAGLGTQINQGAPETGQGAFVTEHPLTYWGWQSTVLGTIPRPAPPAVSLNVRAPTLLPRGGRAYAINPAVAGQTSVAWTFQKTTAAPRATELVITFVDGLVQPTTTITVYVEINIRGIGTAATYLFYWDAGTFAPGAFEIETMSKTVLACTAIGVCP
jgi:hypothetical protein